MSARKSAVHGQALRCEWCLLCSRPATRTIDLGGEKFYLCDKAAAEIGKIVETPAGRAALAAADARRAP